MSDDDKDLPWLEPAVEDPAEGSFLEHYRMAIIAAGIFVIVTFVLIIWQVYSGSGVQEGGEVPLVRAEDGPVKVKPEEPGGMEIPDRDKLIYGQVAGEQDDSEAPHLLPGPETPLDMNTPVAAPPETSGAEVAPAPAPQAPVAIAPPVDAPKPAPVATAPASGEYLIQLGAFSDRAKALSAWAQIQGKFAGVLPKLTPDVVAIDRGAAGVLYRLQAGRLADKAKADELCATLKAKAQPCIVVRR